MDLLVPHVAPKFLVPSGVGPSMAEKLTIQDPVDPETLQQFTALDSARYDIGDQLLDLEQERIKLLAAAHQVDAQKKRLFERVLVERGLDTSAPVTIEFKTGMISLVKPKS